jgi:hypothetical protein
MMNVAKVGLYPPVDSSSHNYDSFGGSDAAPVPQTTSLHCDNGMSSQHHHQQHHHQHHHHLAQHSMLSNNEMLNLSGQGGYLGQHNLSPDSVLAQQQALSNNIAFHQQMQANASISLQATHGNTPNSAFAPRSDANKNKFTGSIGMYFNPHEPRPMDPARFTPTVIEPTSVPIRFCKEKYTKSPPRKNRYDREASTSSLRVDKIFSDDKHGYDASSAKGKFNSSTMSVMSLSVDGLNHPEITDPNALGPLFNTSLKLGTTSQKNVPRRLGSLDGDSSITYEKGMASVFEMSVNTLGDQLSEFGDSVLMPMSESQAEMSLGNVFEDNDRDAYVRASGYF